MTISLSLILSLIVLLIFIVILVLVGRWFLKIMELGAPWPTVLNLVVLVIVIIALAQLLFGGGPFIHVGEVVPQAHWWLT